jgi:hypothetical protein
LNLKIVFLIFLVTFVAASASLMTLQMTIVEEESQSIPFSSIPSFGPTGDPIDDPNPRPNDDNSTLGP